jgi:eukaryotic-like serine/threonine-protein kinase
MSLSSIDARANSEQRDRTAPLPSSDPPVAPAPTDATRILRLSHSEVPPANSDAIRALLEQLCSEQRQMWQRGQRVPVEAYLDAYPILRNNPAAVTLVRGEFLLRSERGERPNVKEYEVRFPHLIETLRRQLQVARLLVSPKAGPAGRSPVTPVVCLPPSVCCPSSALPTIPGYEILCELGRGGMGVVYKAKQAGLDRIVALKTIRNSSLVEPDFRQRFRSEAQAVARMQHPNIVQIFEIGMLDGSDTPYFSLEFVEGGDLGDWLAVRSPEPRHAAELVRTMARAMHYAHENDVVHRDLKPANILMTKDGQPKITDFGLAKNLDTLGQNSVKTPATAFGVVMGTPEYMAPEQASSLYPVGPAADIYALGVILYEMLTGRCPFEGRNALETIEQHRLHDPVPPRRLRPRTPRDLETITLKCLEKDPARRYPTAQGLAEDLGRFLALEPILARPLGLMGRTLRWARRRPAIASLLGILILTITLSLAGIGAALLCALEGWQTADQKKTEAHNRAVEADQQRDLALQRKQEAEKNLYLNCIAAARLQWRGSDYGRTQNQLNLCLPRPDADALTSPLEHDQRGWEWHFLNGLLHADLGTVSSAHEMSVNAMRFTRDGNTLVSAGGNPYVANKGNGSLKLWDAHTQRSLNGWKASSNVFSMDLLADDAYVAVQGWDGSVRIHRTNDNQFVRSFDEGFFCAAAVPENHPLGANTVAMVNAKGVQVRDALTGQLHHVIPLAGSPTRFQSLAFHPNGVWLAVNQTNQVQIVDTVTGKTVRTVTQPHLNSSSNPAFSPDGTLLALGNNNQAIVWDLATGQVQYTLSGHNAVVQAVAFSPDCVHLATGSSDSTVRVWNTTSGQEEQALIGHKGRVKTLLYHPNGRTLLSSGEQPAEIKMWDMTRTQEAVNVSLLNSRNGPPDEALAFSADGRRLLRLGRGPAGNLEVCDSASGAPLSTRTVPMYPEWRAPSVPAAFSRPDSGEARLATVLRDPNAVEIQGIDSKRVLRTLRFPFPVVHLAISADGRRLAASGLGLQGNKPMRDVQVCDVETGKILGQFQPAPFPYEAFGWQRRLHGVVALNSDGSLIAFDDYPADKDPRDVAVLLHVHDVDAGRKIHEIRDHEGMLNALAFSPRGAYLASSSSDGRDHSSRVFITDLSTGRPLHSQPLAGPPFVYDLAFHPTEARLALATREQVYLWDAASGQELLTLRGTPQRPSDNGFNPHVVWSPDGNQLAATNWNATISIWTANRFPEANDSSLERGNAQRQKNRFEADRRALHWHLNWARQVEWYARAQEFHHAQSLQLEPRTPQDRIERARLSARVGSWDKALDDFNQAWQSPEITEAGNPLLDHEYALLHLHMGDVEAMKRVLASMKEKFGGSDDSRLLRWLILTGGLDKRSGVGAADLLEWTKGSEKESRIRGYGYALGLAYYRAGRQTEALRSLDEALKDASNPLLHIPCLLLQAMAHQRLKDADNARQCLKRAEKMIQERQDVAPPGSLAHMPPHARWFDWIAIQLLLKEAQAVVNRTPPS